MDTEIQEIVNSSSRTQSSGKEHREFATSTWYQFMEVYKRLNLVFWRNPEYKYALFQIRSTFRNFYLLLLFSAGRFVQGTFVGVMTAISYLNIGYSSSDVGLVLFVVLLMIILGIYLIIIIIIVFKGSNNYYSAINLILATQTQFMLMRDLFKRDYASKYYSSLPFALSTILVEIPYLITIAYVDSPLLY